MKIHHTLLALLFATTATVALAAPQPGNGLDGKDNKQLRFLAAEEIDAGKLLPPAPAADSPTTQAELGELRQFLASRSAQRLALAKQDAEVENVTAFEGVMGTGFDLARLPATAKLFADLRNDEHIVVGVAKKHFARQRPWELDSVIAADPNLKDCDKGGTHSSYPSGHTLMGYTAGGLLARLVPAKAPDVLARAREYADSRLVCAVHYPSDLEASHALSVAILDALLAKPAFRAEFEAARVELVAAHLVP